MMTDIGMTDNASLAENPIASRASARCHPCMGVITRVHCRNREIALVISLGHRDGVLTKWRLMAEPFARIGHREEVTTT